MVNPNRVHRTRAIITKLGICMSEFKTLKGYTVRGFDIDPKFMVGDEVNIQCQFSIVLDQYIVKTVNFPRKRTVA